MNGDQLRRAILDHPVTMKQLMLTEWQRRAIQYVNDHPGCCSHDVAKAWDISIPSMSACLRTCFDKGYLTREQMADPTGGYRFVYRAAYPNAEPVKAARALEDAQIEVSRAAQQLIEAQVKIRVLVVDDSPARTMRALVDALNADGVLVLEPRPLRENVIMSLHPLQHAPKQAQTCVQALDAPTFTPNHRKHNKRSKFKRSKR